MATRHPQEVHRFPMSGSPPPNTKIIDWLRFVLAAYVCVHHASYLLWQNPAFAGHFLPTTLAPAAPVGALTTVAAAFSLFWEEAVHLFFIISGFCIHYRLASQPEEKGHAAFATGPYLRHRLLRIVPPCWAAILMTVGVDAIGMALNPDFYSQHFLVKETGRGWFHFVGNLLFLQQDTGPVKLYGTNVPLWSLHCEMMYYLAYPLAIALASRVKSKLAVWVGLFAASVAVLLIFPGNVLPRAVREAHFWFGGAVVAELFLRHGWRAGWWAVISGAVLMMHQSVVTWVGAPAGLERAFALSAKVGKLFGGELLFFGLLTVGQTGGWLGRLVTRIEFRTNPGYSLYLIHYPLLALASAAWLHWRGVLPATPWLALGLSLVVIGLSFGFYKLVEEPAQRLKAKG